MIHDHKVNDDVLPEYESSNNGTGVIVEINAAAEMVHFIPTHVKPEALIGKRCTPD